MKHFYITLFFIVSFFSTAFAQDTFRMKIRISSSNETFTIPTNINETYNYDVRWSDPYQSGGVTIITAFENGFTGDATHMYTEARDYIITIRGTFPRIFFTNTGDTQKVVSIEQWGNNTWTSMREAFYGCTNLEINATDTPNLSNCTDMQDMFRECISLKDNGGAVQNWNVSTITNFNRAFARAPIDETFGFWNVSNAIQMTDMFEGIQLSSDNYDDTLNRWALLSLNNNVSFSAGNSTYCNASLARNNILTNPSEFNWTIIDGGEACEEDKFITTWETTTENETITIPTAGSGYNYTVNWGDGSISVGNTSDVTHTFETPGIHNIEIYGDFPRIYFDNSGDRSKILTIEQWGKQQWTNMNSAFEGCNNLKLNADDTPDLSIVTSMEKMFRGTSNLEDLKGIIGNWNTGNIINMRSLFRFSGFNENINAWNVANVQEMGLIFGGTSTFNQPLNNWDVRNVTSLNLAFSNARKFNQDISSWKLQSLANTVGIENLFINATDFNQNLGALDLSNIPDNSQLSSFFVGTSMSQENYEATLIGWATLDIANGETRIPRGVPLNSSGLSYCNAATARQSLIGGESWRISGDAINCTEADKFITTWQTTSNNESIQIRTSGGGSFYNVEWGDGTTSENQGGNSSHTYATAGTYIVKISGAFARLYTNNFTNIGNKMRSVEQWGTGQWSSFDRAFEGAGNVVINATDIPDLSNVTNMFKAFKDCRKLVDNGGQMKNWNLSTVENFRSTFQGASVFDEDLGDWDLSNATDLVNMLNGTNLSTANYDTTLISWARNPNTPDNLNLGASGLTYCLGESARTILDIDKNWEINDGGSACASTDFFITTWRTTTANQSITIPTTEIGYNYDIDWGDGTIEFGYTGNATHTYTTAGVYRVKIIGDFPRIYFNNTGSKDLITSIDQWGTQQWTSMERAFYGCTALELNVTDAPDLSLATSLERMFMGTNNIVDNEASMNSWNTSTITNMAYMFADSIFDFNITSWDVGKVENFLGMFNNNAQFNQNIGGWNVGEFVTGTITMQAMFDSASRFNQSLNTWDISKVTNMVSMFGFATAFNQPLDTWDTSNVENMGGMFFGASDFDQNVGDWNLSSVTNMGAMFQQSGLSIENYDATLIGWAKQDVGETIPSNISISFEGSQYCFGAEARNTLIDDSGFNWSISDDGAACASTDFFITTWQTTADNESITIPTVETGYNYDIDWGDGTVEYGNIANASHNYETAGTYTVRITGDFPRIYFNNDGDSNKIRTIEQWGTQQWISMQSAFEGCRNLVLNADDTPNLSNVTDMSRMFRIALNLVDNKDVMNSWDTSNVTNMDALFQSATKFNENITSWNVGKVTDFSNMFGGSTIFNQNIGSWNIGEFVAVSDEINMAGMFNFTEDFNQPLNNWDVSKVNNLSSMFSGTQSFNQPLDIWDTSAVENMSSMFLASQVFDQDLGAWDISKVISMNSMFTNAEISTVNYDSTLIGWSSLDTGETQIPTDIMFNGGNSTYCLGEAARNILTNTPYNWTITDGGLSCNFTNAFITTWETTTANESITIPTTGAGYNYSVDWGDGTIEVGFTANATHEYTTARRYTIKITGDFPRIFFNNGGNKNKILTIEQWGTIAWESMAQAFNGCANLTLNAMDSPDLSLVTNATRMFANTTNFEDLQNGIGQWNTASIDNMNAMFIDSGFNEDVGDWDVSNVTNFSGMFYECPNFNQDLGNWDISEVINMRSFITTTSLATNSFSLENYDKTLKGWATLDPGETRIPRDVVLSVDLTRYCDAFAERAQLVNDYNWRISDLGLGCPENEKFITTWQTTTSNETITIPSFGGESYNYVIEWGDNITSVVTDDTPPSHTYTNARTYTIKITGDFPRVFFNGTGDKDKILSIEQWGSQQWSNMNAAFRGCTNLVLNASDIPDLSVVQFMDSMFRGTTSFVDNGGEMNNWDITNVISLVSLFEGSTFNENINNWNVSGVQTMGNMFQDNTAFNQSLNLWRPENVSDFEHMFHGATSFNKPIGDWTMTDAAFFESMFEGAVAFDQDLGNWDISTTDRDGMINMFVRSGMSQNNYDATLIGWATLDIAETQIPANVQLDADATYCLGITARNTLTTAPYNWMITDGGVGCDFTGAFITTWQTTSANESITIPTTGSGYNYNIDWGDGTIEGGFTGDVTHEYATAGTYTVKITGDFPRIYFNNTGDINKISSIEQWGTIQWASFQNAFDGCTQLQITATDAPDLSNVNNLSRMFRRCRALASPDFSNWDTSTITNMKDMFYEADNFNGNIRSWNVGRVTNFELAFYSNFKFNQNISSWNIGEFVSTKVINMNSMFSTATSFNQPIGNWDLSKVSNIRSMFFRANTFNQPLNSWDVSGMITLKRLFFSASSFNQPLDLWDVSSISNMDEMFWGASSFDQNLGNWDISEVTLMNNLFLRTAMSTANYDATLIGWATLEVGETQIPIDIDLSADATYCLAEAARNMLTSAPYNWNINDGGLNCDNTPPVITLLGDNPQEVVLGDGYTELGATTDDGSQVVIDDSEFMDTIGTYTIYYNATDASGNMAIEVTRTVNVVPVLSVEDRELDQVIITPNPANDYVQISGLSDRTDIHIYTINGVRLKQISVTKINRIDIRELSSGVYFVKVIAGTSNKTFKLIKE
ncbi:BspA family leucine-rich repeat surface protein [Aquimarina sp. 2201CG5-10]|uniref:BspA family leucine-rich repeat surface protein n=1 Tax=Aquimarina callyspongiae TaxID=3098150 RepID=UPI002AB3FCD0|nr:BspA family leucine-rich repeat surface protein [Aquimarina sp. 2201CG5-10]MDY8138035.1 BspA family leucine-rich repeat surface protein [Aquimarina sp. 2201CG5-10]